MKLLGHVLNEATGEMEKNMKKGKNSFYGKYIKRLLDILFSSLALVVLGIPMLIVGILIKKDMGSPVLLNSIGLEKTTKSFV